MNYSKYKRLSYIDFLKSIGLFCIILAHVGPPESLMMIRQFDVPLMVIISSVLARISYDRFLNRGQSTSLFYFLRFCRLVIPVEIFLVFYFLIRYYLLGSVMPNEYYIYSFLLTRYGIGYVWIILIYIYSALLIPLFNKTKLSKAWIIFFISLYGIYEVMCHFRIGFESKLFETTFYYIIPYGVLTFLGFNYYDFYDKTKKYIICISLLLFIILGSYYWAKTGFFQSVQAFKYPPRMYYLGYGIGCSFLLMHIFGKHDFKIYRHPCIRFVSMNSMWIYLVHIAYIDIYDLLKFPSNWCMKLIFVFVLSSLSVYIGKKTISLIKTLIK